VNLVFDDVQGAQLILHCKFKCNF